MKSTTSPDASLPLAFDGPEFLGNGVAVRAICAELFSLRRDIAWRIGALTRQDAQRWRPHVTVQNKVDVQTARDLFERLKTDPECRASGQVLGLQIWQYLGGPWAHKSELTFGR